MSTEEGQVVDAKGRPIKWRVDDGSCPKCGTDSKRVLTALSGKKTCTNPDCLHEWKER